MSYPTSVLTTTADCDVVLAFAAKEKAAFAFKKVVSDRETLVSSEIAAEIESELQSVISDIALLESQIAGLPEGTLKEKKKDELTKQVYRKFTLENRKETRGGVAYFFHYVESNQSTLLYDDMDAIIAAVTAHRGTI